MHKITIMTKKTIGQVIAKARKAKEISYYKINDKAKVQRHVVKSIEKGDKNYSIDSLLATAEVLGVEIKCG